GNRCTRSARTEGSVDRPSRGDPRRQNEIGTAARSAGEARNHHLPVRLEDDSVHAVVLTRAARQAQGGINERADRAGTTAKGRVERAAGGNLGDGQMKIAVELVGAGDL